MPRNTPPHRARSIILFFVFAIGGICWFYFFDPAAVDAFLPCPFHAATGLDCPGCGTQRAIHQLLHGNLAAAFQANAMILLILPLTLLAVLQWYTRDVLRCNIRQTRIPGVVIAVLILIVMIWWVVRNLY